MLTNYDFLHNTIKNILGLPMTLSKSNEKKYIVSKNIFYEKRNLKILSPLGDICANALQAMILDNIINNAQKKANIAKYFELFLTEEEKQNLKNSNNYITDLIISVVSKFNSITGIESIKYLLSDANNLKKIYAEKTYILYSKILRFFSEDISISFSIINNLLGCILKSIKSIENINADIGFDKLKLIPNNVLISIENLKTTLGLVNLDKCNDNLDNIIKLCNDELLVILHWFIHEYLKEDSYDIEFVNKIENVSSELKIINTKDLIKCGWSLEDIQKEAILIDYETIDNVEPEHVGTFDQWFPIIETHPENRKMLIDKDLNIIGYWSYVQLFDEYYEKAKNGELLDSEIDNTMIPILIPGYVYNIYFLTICLREQYRMKIGLRQLITSLIDTLDDLAKRDIFINEICTLAYSDNGLHLSKGLGLKYYKDHKDSGEMYYCKVKDLLDQPICNKYTELKKLYESKF
ncbi:MAG: hypothetical protein ABF289_16820 [Clostridiales bacterium]